MRQLRLKASITILLVLLSFACASVACNLYPGIPVTPTLATYLPPTYTETATSTVALIVTTVVAMEPSPTATSTLTSTATPSMTMTLTQSATPTLSSTATPTASIPPLVTHTSTPRPTTTATITASATSSATATPTFTASPTVTNTPIPTAIATIPATATPPVRPNLTQTAASTFGPRPVVNTPQPSATPTTTPAVIILPTPIILPNDALITAGPPSTRVPSQDPAIAPAASATATPFAVAIQPTALILNQGAWQVGTEGGTLEIPLRNSDGGTASSSDINSWGMSAVVNADGSLMVNGAPFDNNGKHLISKGKRITMVRWSPDGRYLAYIVQTDNALSGQLPITETVDDGVWVLDTGTGAVHQVFQNTYYVASNEYPLRVAVDLNWAADSYALMVSTRQTNGLGVVLVGLNGEQQALPYHGVSWLPDSSAFVTTIYGQDGVTLLLVDRQDRRTVIINSLTAGIWIQNPTLAPGGGYAFLGKPSPTGQLVDGATNLQLYLYFPGSPTPIAVSQPLNGTVLRAEWNPGRNALLVILRSPEGAILTQVITLDGRIIDYTAQTKGAYDTHWSW